MSETYKSAIKDDKKPLIKHGFISKGSIICVTRSDYIAQCTSIVFPPPPSSFSIVGIFGISARFTLQKLLYSFFIKCS